MERKHFILKVLSLVVPLVIILIVFLIKRHQLYVYNSSSISTKDTQPAWQKLYYETLLKISDPEPAWKVGDVYGTYSEPFISGYSGIVVELTSDKVLFEKNSTDKMKIASLTKIMTAIVALEHKPLDTKISISNKAANIGENAMGVSENEVYTLKELLDGLIMNSGNDAAYAIAEGVAGDSDRFVAWMNMKAKELGLNDTYFADSSGLNDDTYSTAQDLVKLTRYTLKNPKFREIVRTLEAEEISDMHKYLYLTNQTNLLNTYPGVEGVKTGYTEDAGLCLVTYAKNNGKELIGVVLKSNDRKGDMVMMLDHAFGTLGIKVEHPALSFN